jgi:integrase
MALLWPGWEQKMKTKYPGIEIMSDGRKRIRVRAVDPRTGRMKERDRIIEGTVQEAARLRQEWMQEIHHADDMAKEVPRLRTYVQSWLASKALGLKASTARTYANLLGAYVLPHLGDFFMDKLTDAEVRDWQAKLANRLAGATVNGAMIMLRMVMADAVVEYQLPRNPTERVRRLPMRKFTDEEPNLLTAEELGRLMKAFRDYETQHYPLAMTLAMTGVRSGEGTAFRWGDIDEEAGVIHVRRAQWSGVVDSTKTGMVRSVPLVPELAAVLNEHRARLSAKGLRVSESDWVFPDKEGGLLPRCSLRHPMERALKLAKITKRVTPHGLRRTFNNLARQVAGDIVTRSITGHVTEAMTEHYSHVAIDEKLRAANNIVRLVPGLSKSAAQSPSGGSSGGSKEPSESESDEAISA